MSSFTFTVDTSPMADTLATVSDQVVRVTGAVTVMQAAVIWQEEQAARKVCSSIDMGFYFLIRSQISQKIAKERSVFEAKLMVLKQLSVAMSGIQKQMESDYRMIASRNSKLFDRLNRSLQSRVFELDRVAADLGCFQLPRILKRLRDNGAQYLISGVESLPTGQAAVSSKIKGNTNRVIGSMKRGMLDAVRLKQELKSVVLDRQVEARRLCYVPLLVMEVDAPRLSGTMLNIVPAGGGQMAGSREIERRVRDRYSELLWAPAGTQDEVYVDKAFSKVLSQNQLDSRIQNEVLRLHHASSWQSAMAGGA